MFRELPITRGQKLRLASVFVLAALMLMGVGLALYQQYDRLMSDRQSVRHTYDVLLQTKEIFVLLQDMETGQRGFLLTGEKEFLQPYQEAKNEIDRKVMALRRQVAENPRRVRQIDEMLKVINTQRQLLQRQINQRDTELKNSIITLREAETAKATMDHLRSLIDRMVEDERSLLDTRSKNEQERRDAFVRLLLLCVLLSLLGLVVTNGMMMQMGIRRKNTEDALARVRDFSSIIVNSSPDRIELLNMQGEVLSINPAGCEHMEIDDVQNVLNRPWTDFWEGEYEAKAIHALEEARRGSTGRFDGYSTTLKGKPKWWEVVVTPVHDRTGATVQLLCVARDITERHHIDSVLRASEGRFREMADTMPQMIWITLPDGYHEYYNKRWYEFTGVPEGSTDGEEWNGMFHPDDQERAWKRWQHSLETGEPYEIEYRLRRADGVYCWTLGRALPVRDAKGVITKWYGTCTVIDEQKRVEAEMREARDIAQAANEAKSEFLANMSHEIRTPMNAVVGLANLLQHSTLTAEKRKEFIKTIQMSAQQLMDLINDLLDVSKLDSQHMDLEKIPFNLAELLEEIISIMGVKAKERKIELLVKYEPELNGNFMGDPLRLRQVLMNLVSNAIKFTDKGMVTLHAFHCAARGRDDDVCFEVVDTGIGIAPEKIETIFSKFSQADTSITRKYGGTGLGLSICKTLVELMQGRITVVSTPGLGSKFTAHVPLGKTEGKPAELKNRRPMSGAPRGADGTLVDQGIVLLVEDYKANIMVATQTIEDCGYRWELAENGEEALERVATRSYDIILMDVQMPVMDGMSATRKIRRWELDNGRKRTPILGITAYSMEGDRDKCLDAGMDDYLSKPFNPEELKDKIRMLTKAIPR